MEGKSATMCVKIGYCCMLISFSKKRIENATGSSSFIQARSVLVKGCCSLVRSAGHEENEEVGKSVYIKEEQERCRQHLKMGAMMFLVDQCQ